MKFLMNARWFKKYSSAKSGFLILLASLISFSYAHAEESSAAIGKELSNPVGGVWALFTEIDYNYYKGDATSAVGADYKEAQAMTFEPLLPMQLNDDWKVMVRPTIPLLSTPMPQSTGLGGIDFDRRSGFGDLALPILLSRLPKPGDKKSNFSFSGGPTFTFPVASNKYMGGNHYEAGVAGMMMYKSDKVTAGMMPQYWWSYAKANGAEGSTGHGNMVYFYYYELGNAWQIGTNPTITYDAKATSGNKWNIPVGVTVGKTTKIGGTHVKFQLGIEYAIKHQDYYGAEWRIKLNIIPVIQPLVKGKIFN
jgi:hypothetical protein